MGLGRIAPIVCLFVLAVHAASSITFAFASDVSETWLIHPSQAVVGGLATIVGLPMLLWLILDTVEPARSWAKAAIALLLVGPAIWNWTVWPRFFDGLGGECFQDCARAYDYVARWDVIQGEWAIAVVNTAAAMCGAYALWLRQRRTA
jgi:hypothetical protein